MSNESSQQLSEVVSDSAPKGAELISAASETGDCLEPELLERIEDIARSVAVTTVKHEMHSGPMPAPKQLKEYDAVLPGTALIIREEFQANGKHVRLMEERGQTALIENDKDNRRTAERLVWASLVLILLLALSGHEGVAIAVSVTTVAAVITGFLSKKEPPKREEEQEGLEE